MRNRSAFSQGRGSEVSLLSSLPMVVNSIITLRILVIYLEIDHILPLYVEKCLLGEV